MNESCVKCLPAFKRIRARYFLDYISLFDRCRRRESDNVDRLLREIRYESARREGKRLAQQAERKGLAELMRLYWDTFPDTEVVELRPERLVCRAHRCAFRDAFLELGLTEERVRELSDLFCLVEEAVTAGFNAQVRFRQVKNLMQGDEWCEWVLELPAGGDGG